MWLTVMKADTIRPVAIKLDIQKRKYLSHIGVPDVFRTQAKAPEATVATEIKLAIKTNMTFTVKIWIRRAETSHDVLQGRS